MSAQSLVTNLSNQGQFSESFNDIIKRLTFLAADSSDKTRTRELSTNEVIAHLKKINNNSLSKRNVKYLPDSKGKD